MKTSIFPLKSKKTILALGAESAGNFSVFYKNAPADIGVGGIYFSEDFGDLLDDKNYKKFQKSVLYFLKKNKIKPDIILTDLHPEYRTTLWGKELSKKFKAKHIQIQHHHAHIFSAIGEQYLQTTSYKLQANTIGIALDGTGYGLDGKIWGGEVFECQMSNVKCRINRIGQLENQIMIGGDLAVKEPARMLIGILHKLKTQNSKLKTTTQNSKLIKKFIFSFVKKYYSENQSELLYNQLEQNFNCVETSSAGRVLDAVSILLGFCGNKRNYKHEPIDLLEKNSTIPYNSLKTKITSRKKQKKSKLQITNYQLQTTPLFEYLIKNLHKDKKRLAATAQLYIAQGLYEIAKKQENSPTLKLRRTSKKAKKQKIFLAGGLGNNKIISKYLESNGIIINKKIPRGDAGISFGQMIYHLLQRK